MPSVDEVESFVVGDLRDDGVEFSGEFDLCFYEIRVPRRLRRPFRRREAAREVLRSTQIRSGRPRVPLCLSDFAARCWPRWLRAVRQRRSSRSKKIRGRRPLTLPRKSVFTGITKRSLRTVTISSWIAVPAARIAASSDLVSLAFCPLISRRSFANSGDAESSISPPGSSFLLI